MPLFFMMSIFLQFSHSTLFFAHITCAVSEQLPQNANSKNLRRPRPHSYCERVKALQISAPWRRKYTCTPRAAGKKLHARRGERIFKSEREKTLSRNKTKALPLSITLHTLPPCCYCPAAHFICWVYAPRRVIYMQLRPDSTWRNVRKKGPCAVFAAAIETLTLTAAASAPVAARSHNSDDSTLWRNISVNCVAQFLSCKATKSSSECFIVQ